MDKAIKKIADLFFVNESIDSLALGGSRARGLATNKSDIDLFCVVYESDFNVFKDNFVSLLMQEYNMIIAAELFYLDNWGYIFKCIGVDMIEYDISIISDIRIDELGIKHSNILLFDKSGLYTLKQTVAVDDYNNQEILAEKKRANIVSNIIIDLFSVLKEIYDVNEYWNCVKYIERIRRNIMILMRMNQNCVGAKYFSPEKKFPKLNHVDELYSVYSCPVINMDVYDKWKTLFLNCCNKQERELANETISFLETTGGYI